MHECRESVMCRGVVGEGKGEEIVWASVEIVQG